MSKLIWVGLPGLSCLMALGAAAAQAAEVPPGHAAVFNEFIAATEEYANVLSGITDQATALAARERVVAVNDRLEATKKKMMALPKVAADVDQEIQRQFKPRVDAAAARLNAENARCAGNRRIIAGLRGEAPDPNAPLPRPPSTQPGTPRSLRPPQPDLPALSAQDLNTALTDLRSGDRRKSRVALRTLARCAADPEKADTVAQALTPLLKGGDAFGRVDAARALKTWATTKQVPDLIAALQDESAIVRHECIRGLGRLKDLRAAEAMLANFDKDGGAVQQALIDMGPLAEPAALKLLQSNDIERKTKGADILKQIGTAASLSALHEAAKIDQGFLKGAAERAMAEIKRRAAAGGP